MIVPAELDLYLRRNDNPFYMRVNMSEEGLPVNLNGYYLRMNIRKYKGATGTPDLIATSSAQAPNSRLVVANGYWEMFLTKTAIDALPLAAKLGESRVMYYDILFTDINGYENAWYEGKIFIDPGVTI